MHAIIVSRDSDDEEDDTTEQEEPLKLKSYKEAVVALAILCIGKCSRECGSCPLSGIQKRPLLGGCLSITTMVISIRNTDCVRCREVVCFSEGPLTEVRL